MAIIQGGANMDIGNKIKLRREELRMRQDELAIKVGYKSRSSINKIEIDGRGLPQSKIKLFADALDNPSLLDGMGIRGERGGNLLYQRR